jgi:hypothetical protein
MEAFASSFSVCLRAEHLHETSANKAEVLAGFRSRGFHLDERGSERSMLSVPPEASQKLFNFLYWLNNIPLASKMSS